MSGFLEACPLPFSIEIAAALAARKLLNLETWLLELLQTHQDAAVQVPRMPTAHPACTCPQAPPVHRAARRCADIWAMCAWLFSKPRSPAVL